MKLLDLLRGTLAGLSKRRAPIDWPALYSAVAAEPDSDEPRLVLADALQAEGDPRGELIAVQCELARLGCGHVGIETGRESVPEHDWVGDALIERRRARLARLRARERALLEHHRERWTDGLGVPHRFERGFVEHVEVHGALDLGAVFDRAPLLRSVELWAAPARQLAELTPPRLARLRHLGVKLDAQTQRTYLDRIAGELGDCRSLRLATSLPVLSELAMSPVARRLEALELDGDARAGLGELLARASVRDLRIRNGKVGEGREAGRLLATAPALGAIESLHLVAAEMRHEIANIIRAAPELKLLRVREHGNDWLEVVLPAIAQARGLRVLDLTQVDLQRHLRYLLGGTFPRLRVFRAGYCRIDDDGMRALAAAPLISSLRVLELPVNLTGNDVIASALLRSPFEPPLEVLVVNTPMDPSVVRRLRGKYPKLEVEVAS